MSPALERQHGSSKRLSGGLHGGLAGTAVLLVLTALSGVAALDFGGVGARDGGFNHAADASGPVGVREHRDDALSGVGARALVTINRRLVVVFCRVVTN